MTALSRIGASAGSDSINVRNYGAIGDGVHDDTSAIADALDAAIFADKECLFPRGTYYCNPMQWSRYEINGVLRISGDSATIHGGGSDVSGSFIGLSSGACLDVRSVTFSGWNIAIDAHDDDAASLSIKLDSCKFTGCKYGIYGAYSADAQTLSELLITRSEFDGSSGGNFGVRLHSGTFGNVIVSACRFHNYEPASGTACGLQFGASENLNTAAGSIQVLQCDFDAIVGQVTGSWGVISYNDNTTCQCCKFKDIGPTASGNDASGVYSKGNNLSVSGCTFENAGGIPQGAITVKGGDRHSIANNLIYFSRSGLAALEGAGIYISSSYSSICDNIIINDGGECNRGIRMDAGDVGTRNMSICGNVIAGLRAKTGAVNAYGIFALAPENMLIGNNSFYDISGVGAGGISSSAICIAPHSSKPVNGVLVDGNTANGIDGPTAAFVQIAEATATTQEIACVSVTNNVVYDCPCLVRAKGAQGVFKNLVVARNRISGYSGAAAVYPIYFIDVQDFEVAENFIANTSPSSSTFDAIRIDRSSDSHVVNGIIRNNRIQNISSQSGAGAARGIIVSYTSADAADSDWMIIDGNEIIEGTGNLHATYGGVVVTGSVGPKRLVIKNNYVSGAPHNISISSSVLEIVLDGNIANHTSGSYIGWSAAPAIGTWQAGQSVRNSSPAPGGSIGWVCTTGGSPGTWKSYGTIES